MRSVFGNLSVTSISGHLAANESPRERGAFVRSYRRQLHRLSLAAAGVTLIGSFAYAQDTALNVPLSTTDLFATSPTTTSDLTFINGTYTSPGAIQVSSSISIGTLDDLDTLQALTVTNTGSGTITLDSLTNATPGSLPADLLYVSSGSSLTVNAPIVLGLAGGNFDVGGTAVIGGGISSGGSAYGFTKIGTGTLTLNGSSTNTYTGATAINRGNLTLDFTSMGATPNVISSSSALQMGGGNLNIVGNSAGSTQTFASTAVQSGYNAISVGQTNANNPTLNLAAMTESPGGTVEFVGPATINASGNVAATGTITTTTAGNTGAVGLLGGNGVLSGDYATVGLYDWATTDVAGGTAGTSPFTIIGGSQVTGFYTAFGTGNNTLAGNVDFTAATSGSHNTDTIQSIRFNVPGGCIFSPGSVVDTGGILVTPNVGASNVQIEGTAGEVEPTRTGTAGNWQMVIWQNNIDGFLIGNVNNTFNDAKSPGIGNYVFTGISTVQLDYPNSYTGSTYIEGSALVYMPGNYLGSAATGATVNLNGGTIVAGATFALDNAGANAHPVVLGSNGGGLAAAGVSVFTVDGLISGAIGSGPLVIGIPASSSNGNTVGLLPSTGAGTANTTAVNATGTVVLSNTSNSYTGGTVLDSGILQLASANLNVLGTGGITLNGGTFQWASSNTTDISVRPITLASTGIFDTQANTVSLANPIGNHGAGGFTKAGSGTLTLNGSNTFTGGVTVNVGTLAFGGANIYTGPTAVNAGTLALNGTAASLGNTAITVAGGATFAAKPGVSAGNISVGTTGASLTLNSTANFSLADGFVDQLTLNSVGAGTANTVLSLNGANLSFDVGATGASELIANDGTFASSATNNISIASIGVTHPSSLTSIPILTVPNASGNVVLSDFNLMTTAINFGSTSYVASLSTNVADTTLYLNLTAASLSYYFAGGVSGSFGNASNFVNGPTSATLETAAPGATNDVFITANSGFANATNSANITLNGSYTINSLTFTGTGTITPVTLGPGSGGTLTVEGANSFSDTNTSNNYNAGTGLVVEAGAGADTISANINLGASQTWEIDNSASSPLTVSGNIGNVTAGFSLTKTGAGKLILSGSNSYSGGTNVAAGILQLGAGASNALPANAPLNVSGGTLDLNGNTVTASSLSDAGQSAGVVTDSLGGASLSVNNATPTTYSGSITGGLSLTYGGSATWTLSGSNTYTGITTVNSGTIIAASNQPFGNPTSATGGLTLNNSAVVDFTSATPAIASLSSGSSTTGIVLGSSAVAGGAPTTLTVNTSSANPLSFSGTISDLSTSFPAALGSLTTTGNGSLTLNNANTYFGTTTIGGSSTLILGNSLALENSTLNYNNPTGTLSFGSLTAATFGGLSGNQSLSLLNTAASAVALTIGGNNASTTYSGALSGTGGALTKTGSGTVTLSGASTYTGNTVVNAGVLIVTGSIGTATTPAGEVNTLTTGNFQVVGGSVYATSLVLQYGTAEYSFASLTGNGTMNISGAVTVNSGGSEGADTSDLGLISGTASFGSLTVGRTGDTNLTVIETSTPVNDDVYVDGATVTISTTFGLGTAGGTNSSAIYHQDAGNITVGGTTIITNSNGGRYSILDVNGGTFTSNDTAGTGIQIGGVTADVDAELLIRGTAVVTANTITFGDAEQSNGSNVLELLGGTLNVGAGGIVENAAAAFPVTPTINFGGTAYATAPILGAIAPWTSSLSMTLTNSSSGIAPILQPGTAATGPQSIALSGNLNGSGGLTVTGTGTVTLSGANTYSGPTNVSQGALNIAVDGALPAGNTVNVAQGGTLVLPDQTTYGTISSLNLNGNLIVHGGNLATIYAQVQTLYNGGAWNGTTSTPALTSTQAAADTTHLHALGVIQNDNGTGTALYSIFEGQSVSDSDVLVKYTYYGDANLDGKVDGSDYTRIDNGYLNHLTGWFNGDFNYDGVIDGSDYTLIDNAYNTQGAQISSEVAAATAQIAGTGASSAVPEPATLGLIGIGAVGLLGRRSRRRR